MGKNIKLINSSVCGFVIIGDNCYLENCFIGFYSSIVDNVILIDVDIEYSVIL